MADIATLIASAGYLITALLIYRYIRRGKASRTLAASFGAMWAAALFFHAIALGQSLLSPVGLDLSFHNAISLVVWLVSLLLFVTSMRCPMEVVGIPTLSIGAFLIAAGVFHPDLKAQIVQGEPGLEWHVLGSLLAFALFTLSAVQAVVLAYQDHRLRNHQLKGWVSQLPSLQFMESFLFQLIGLGFVLLTLSLISGWLFLDNLLAQHLIHKTALSLLAWIIFGTLLLGRAFAGWRGRTAVRLTLFGFSLLTLAYFGSKLVVEIILGH